GDPRSQNHTPRLRYNSQLALDTRQTPSASSRVWWRTVKTMSGRLAGAFVGLGLAFALATAGSSIVGAAKLATPPAGTVAPHQPIAPAASPASQQRNLLDTYCVTCHNARRRTANLLLDEADVGNVSLRAELWEKVVRKLQAGAMPPTGAPRPETAATQGFVT